MGRVCARHLDAAVEVASDELALVELDGAHARFGTLEGAQAVRLSAGEIVLLPPANFSDGLRIGKARCVRVRVRWCACGSAGACACEGERGGTWMMPSRSFWDSTAEGSVAGRWLPATMHRSPASLN